MRILSLVYPVNKPNWYNSRQSQNHTNLEVQSRLNFSARPPKVEKINMFETLAKKLVSLFTDNESVVPDIFSDVHKIEDGSLLSFKAPLENGKQLFVTKRLSDRNLGRKPYLSIKEIGNGAFKEYIGLDFEGQLIEFDRMNNPLYNSKGKYGPADYSEKHAFLEAKMEEFLSQLFPEDAQKIREHNANLLQHRKPVSKEANHGAEVNHVVNESNSQPFSTLKRFPEAPRGTAGAILQTNENSIPQINKPETASAVVLEEGKKPVVPRKIAQKPAVDFASAGILSETLQKNIDELHRLLDEFNRYTNPSLFNNDKRKFITSFKENYATLIYEKKSGNRGVTFVYGDDGARLKILHMAPTKHSKQDFTTISLIDKENVSQRFMIIDKQKVVKFENADEKFKSLDAANFYTSEELANLPLEKYIDFLKATIKKCDSDIEAAVNDKFPVKKIKHPVQTTVDGTASDNSALPKNKELKTDGAKPQNNASQISQIEIPQVDVKSVQNRAISDAKVLAQAYLDAFKKQLTESLNEGLNSLQKTLDDAIQLIKSNFQ